MLETMTPEEIQARIDEYTDALASGAAISEDLADSYRDASVGIKGFSRQLRSSQALLTTSLGGLVKSISEGNTSATIYNDAISAAAKVTATYAQQIPVLGKALSATISVFGEVAKGLTSHAEQEFKLFQDLSRSGLANGMDDAFKNLQKAGYTMKEIGEFGSLMKQNSTVLAAMGGTAQEGLTKFTKISQNINNSQLGTQLMRMGMTTSQITEGTANYIKFQQMGGQSISKDEKEVAKNAAEFMTEQDKLTKLTGLTADQQNKIREEALASQQYAALEFGLQEEARKYAGTARGEAAKKKLAFNTEMLNNIQTKYGTKTRKSAELYMAGALNTDGAQQFQRTFSETAEYVAAGGVEIGEAANRMGQDAKTTIEQAGELARSGNFDKAYISFGELAKGMSTSNIDMTQAVDEAKKNIKGQKEGKDASTADMVAFTQNERDAAQSAAQVYHSTMGATTTTLKAFSEVTRDAAAVLGKLAGKEGQLGGETNERKLYNPFSWQKNFHWYNPFSWGKESEKEADQKNAKTQATINPPANEQKTPDTKGFASGGYTGDGGKHDPAGIVHKGEYVLDASTTKDLGLNKSISGYSSGGYTGDGGKYEPAGIVHKGEYVIDASTTKDLGLNKTISTGTEYADGGKVNDPKTKSLSGIQTQSSSDEIKKLNSKITTNYQSVMNRIDQLAQKVSSIQAANIKTNSAKPIIKTGSDNFQNLSGSIDSFQSILSTLDKKIETFFSINNKTTLPPVENKKNNVSIDKPVANVTTKESEVKLNQFQSMIDRLNQRITGITGTGNKISTPVPANTTTAVTAGIATPITPEQPKTNQPLANTPDISDKKEQSGFDEVKRLVSGIGSYQGILDLSSKQIKSSKVNTNTVFDSYTTILSEQKTDSENFANELNKAIDPVIKSFSSLTLTTKQLTGLLDELPIAGGEGKETDTGGILGQAKNLISSTFEKIKQNLGLSSGSKMVAGTGDMYQFGAASTAGGSTEKPKDTTTEAVPSGSPPSPGAAGAGGAGKEEGVKPDILAKKTALESAIGKKITVTSGFRAGAANHGDGSAIDLGFGANNFGGEAERAKLYTKALDLGFNGIGAEYKAAGGAHIHLDTTHPGLMGWGSNGTWSELKTESPFLEQLITARRAGKPGPTPPSAATGGVIAGPTSGYEATLHGTEAVVPLPDGRTIPVQTKGGVTSNGAQEQISLLTEELSKLDSLLSIMAKQNDITDRMLKNQG